MAHLDGADLYLTRQSVHTPANVRKCKKAIRKAFENSMARRKASRWSRSFRPAIQRLEAVAASRRTEWLEQNMLPVLSARAISRADPYGVLTVKSDRICSKRSFNYRRIRRTRASSRWARYWPIRASCRDFEVTWMPSYGPEMRGGTANVTVILSDRKISSPIAHEFDTAIILNQQSMEKFEPMVKPGGVLIYDTNGITRHPRAYRHRGLLDRRHGRSAPRWARPSCSTR